MIKIPEPRNLGEIALTGTPAKLGQPESSDSSALLRIIEYQTQTILIQHAKLRKLIFFGFFAVVLAVSAPILSLPILTILAFCFVAAVIGKGIAESLANSRQRR